MTIDAVMAIAGRLEREWGDDGYRFETIRHYGRGGAIGDVVHADGSRFSIAADRWGNSVELDDQDIS